MRALVVRPGGFGGVLLAGPAVRAVAGGAGSVTMWCGPRGAPAARLLPHVDDVLVWQAPWDDDGGPPAVDEADPDGIVGRLRQGAYDVALVLTGGRQSPLPTALLLRTAGVRRIGAAVDDDRDDTGGLLDVRHRRRPDRHPAQTARDVAAALGFPPRAGDDGRLRVLPAPDTTGLTGNGPYVAVHPGSGAPDGAWETERWAEAVALLADAGHRVVVTGGPEEAALTRLVSGDTAVDLGGHTDPRTLSGVLRAADAVVAGNTASAHLAAATGTPVVPLLAPADAASADSRSPYGVPSAFPGDYGGPGAAAGPGGVTAQSAVRAVRHLLQETT
ncbi:glycosyltransferase family 9 protein [Streptomyces sp. NPDC059785]|uniref:glycosyltransferase family 9 protein n=1 Tax=unclassified Streptomyces TaxID=2593676 RepID=UPI003655A730